MKKTYESPSVEKCSLMAQEALMTTTPTVSSTGFGYDDQGPVGNVNAVDSL